MQSLTLCLLGMFLTTAALAGDVEDVIAAEMDSRVQEMAGNVDGYFKYKGSTYTIFPPYRWTSLHGVETGAGPSEIRRGYEV